ncbi:MAG: peptidoglycan-associated lipoprotein Pal [Rhodospirillaceae bacterium]|nr:peptidoglycan-associated lipoprotein Pal [Rhodospirillaceae bacterium]
MKLRTLTTVVAAVLMLAACNSKPKPQAAAAAASSPPPAAAPVAPRGPAPDSIEYFNTVVGNMVHFDFDKYDVTAADQSILRGQAQWLNQYPARTVTIEGHCDERGTREYNLGLGDRRANAVKAYLVSLGVNASRIKTISYGKERPLCVVSAEDCWSKNRRGVSTVQ